MNAWQIPATPRAPVDKKKKRQESRSCRIEENNNASRKRRAQAALEILADKKDGKPSSPKRYEGGKKGRVSSKFYLTFGQRMPDWNELRESRAARTRKRREVAFQFVSWRGGQDRDEIESTGKKKSGTKRNG